MGRDEEAVPLTYRLSESSARSSIDSLSTDGSLLNAESSSIAKQKPETSGNVTYHDFPEQDVDFESAHGLLETATWKKKARRTSRLLWIVVLLCVAGWAVAFVLFLGNRIGHTAVESNDLDADTRSNYGKPITLDSVLSGTWSPTRHSISWIAGPNGEDGLLLQRGGSPANGGYLRVDDVRERNSQDKNSKGWVLMNSSAVVVDGKQLSVNGLWPSPNFKSVLVMADQEKNWRHSYTGTYWLFDVDTQTAQPLDPDEPDGRIQLASWSPRSDAVVFTRDNNMYLRRLSSEKAVQITKDGGKDLFYGVPDWVYEEEVFEGNSATWWSKDGKYVAFLRTNESMVPEFPVQYFMHRPSGKLPPPGLEEYPEVRQIKYPKAGAPNPIVSLEFYDMEKDEVFSVDNSHGFDDDERVIFEVVWATDSRVIVKQTNRESDILKVVLIDVATRTGKVVRSENITDIDGGWVEVSKSTTFVPADPSNGRPADGYIETAVHDNYNHLAYFTPLDSNKPNFLTSGPWEVVNAPSAVDLSRNLVYFVATKEAPTQRHVYSVNLDGTDLKPVTNTSTGYYEASFSSGAGYALLTYHGPSFPWQKVMSTPSNPVAYEEIIEENPTLKNLAKEYALPIEIYEDIVIDDYTLPVVERRPPQFSESKKYPVLFFLYGGPGSQTVDRRFNIDFQSYVASALGYIVVTVDGRGTGHNGRKARCIVRDNLGHWEAHDQIETAKAWARKPYVDENRIAIWGWSYGGYMTLKTLEQDAGQTFRYGMAVAPVTSWKYYGKILSPSDPALECGC